MYCSSRKFRLRRIAVRSLLFVRCKQCFSLIFRVCAPGSFPFIALCTVWKTQLWPRQQRICEYMLFFSLLFFRIVSLSIHLALYLLCSSALFIWSRPLRQHAHEYLWCSRKVGADICALKLLCVSREPQAKVDMVFARDVFICSLGGAEECCVRNCFVFST